MLNLLVYALVLVPALGAVAVGAGQAAAQGRRPWIPLTVVWLAIGAARYMAFPSPPEHPLPGTLLLLAPLGVVALAVEMEVQRGCSILRAGSVGVLLGVSVAAALPFFFGYLPVAITCVTRGSCF